MNWKITKRQARLYLVIIMLLVVGLGSSVVIYLNADNGQDTVTVFQFESSKIYNHNLELVGGKASVLVDQIVRWFDRLRHGRRLAYALSFLTVLVSAGLLVIDHYWTVT